MEGKNNKFAVLAVAVILVGAIALGYGIRQIRLANQALPPEPLPELDMQVDESESGGEYVVEPLPEVEEAEVAGVVDEEPVVEDAPPTAVEPEPEAIVEAEPQSAQWRPGQNSQMIRQFFEEMDLTEEEQARLREGFMARVQQFQSMSEEERQAETARMQGMAEQWESMSDVQHQAVIDRMRERYEDWRRSDSMELPQLTFDLD